MILDMQFLLHTIKAYKHPTALKPAGINVFLNGNSKAPDMA